jgi:hypothetical protein
MFSRDLSIVHFRVDDGYERLRWLLRWRGIGFEMFYSSYKMNCPFE